MKNFLKRHGLWILFAAAVISVALAALSVFSANASPLANIANTLTSPLRAGYTAVAQWFNDMQNYYQVWPRRTGRKTASSGSIRAFGSSAGT